MLNEKVEPWLIQKSIEELQAKEQVFIDLVMGLLANESEPKEIMKKLEVIFMEETKRFVKELWRFIVFEQLKIKYLKD